MVSQPLSPKYSRLCSTQNQDFLELLCCSRLTELHPGGRLRPDAPQEVADAELLAELQEALLEETTQRAMFSGGKGAFRHLSLTPLTCPSTGPDVSAERRSVGLVRVGVNLSGSAEFIYRAFSRILST